MNTSFQNIFHPLIASQVIAVNPGLFDQVQFRSAQNFKELRGHLHMLSFLLGCGGNFLKYSMEKFRRSFSTSEVHPTSEVPLTSEVPPTSEVHPTSEVFY